MTNLIGPSTADRSECKLELRKANRHAKLWLRAATVLSLGMAFALVGCKGSSDEGSGTTDGSTTGSVTGGGKAAASSSTGGSAAGGDVINIGEYGSLSGDTATFGTSTHNGIMLAIEKANAAGGVLGKQLNDTVKDDGSNADNASTVVEALLSQNVAAVLGEVASTRSLRGAPLCQKAHVPMITPSSTNPKVTEVGDYIFRVCFIDSFQGKAIGLIGSDILHAKRAAVLYDNSQDYSKGLKQFIEESFTGKGGTIVKELTYGHSDVDFHGQLTEIKSANPDVIFVPGYYNHVAQIARQARSLGMTQPLIGGDGWDSPELIKIGGAALNNCYFTNHFSPDDKDPVVQGFVKDFEAKYNGTPPDAMAALGYDAAGVLIDAMKRAKSIDGSALRDAIASTKDYKGVSGTITLGPDRNAVKPLVVIKIADGKYTFVKRITP